MTTGDPVEVLARLATGTAAALAASALYTSGAWRRYRSLFAVTVTGAATILGASLLGPYWTPETYVVMEVAATWLLVLFALEFARDACRTRPVLARVSAGIVLAAWASAIALLSALSLSLPVTAASAYRGLVAANAAAAAALGAARAFVVLLDLRRGAVGWRALAVLIAGQLGQTAYVGLLEPFPRAAAGLGMGMSLISVWAMLSIRGACSGHARHAA